ncbi:hypothetical protein AAC03nite_35050 [Alicyclobacillus acidoterrestris]|nr:hypothetical protein AAC03nite_35050 [Alicyclobacillus acidoterrestris]
MLAFGLTVVFVLAHARAFGFAGLDFDVPATVFWLAVSLCDGADGTGSRRLAGAMLPTRLLV